MSINDVAVKLPARIHNYIPYSMHTLHILEFSYLKKLTEWHHSVTYLSNEPLILILITASMGTLCYIVKFFLLF